MLGYSSVNWCYLCYIVNILFCFHTEFPSSITSLASLLLFLSSWGRWLRFNLVPELNFLITDQSLWQYHLPISCLWVGYYRIPSYILSWKPILIVQLTSCIFSCGSISYLSIFLLCSCMSLLPIFSFVHASLLLQGGSLTLMLPCLLNLKHVYHVFLLMDTPACTHTCKHTHTPSLCKVPTLSTIP